MQTAAKLLTNERSGKFRLRFPLVWPAEQNRVVT